MPDPGYFKFGGVSSADMVNKLIIHKVPALNRSAQKIDVFSVPGRDGDIIIPQNAWENQIQEYECYIGDGDATAAADELAAWLFNKNGYQELSDGWEPNEFRLAYLSEAMDIESIMSKVGHVTISFSCIPKRFLNSGKTVTILTETGTITNPTAFTAKPLIVVKGEREATGTVSCGGKTLSFTLPVQNLFIDCETCQAYSVTNVFYNSSISGSFPEIPTGTQTFGITGSVTQVSIVPRWYRR